MTRLPMAMMSGAARATYDDVNLILRLYEMRREDRLREARKWFTGIVQGEDVRGVPGALSRRAANRTRRTGWSPPTGRWWRRS